MASSLPLLDDELEAILERLPTDSARARFASALHRFRVINDALDDRWHAIFNASIDALHASGGARAFKIDEVVWQALFRLCPAPARSHFFETREERLHEGHRERGISFVTYRCVDWRRPMRVELVVRHDAPVVSSALELQHAHEGFVFRKQHDLEPWRVALFACMEVVRLVFSPHLYVDMATYSTCGEFGLCAAGFVVGATLEDASRMLGGDGIVLVETAPPWHTCVAHTTASLGVPTPLTPGETELALGASVLQESDENMFERYVRVLSLSDWRLSDDDDSGGGGSDSGDETGSDN